MDTIIRNLNLEDTEENREHFKKMLELEAGTIYEPMVELLLTLNEINDSYSMYSSDSARPKYGLSILTNNNSIMYPQAAGSFEDLVHQTITSHFVGVSKPEPKIYELLRSRIGDPDPSTILFIDDKERNTIAAEDLGFQTFVFDSPKLGMKTAFYNLLIHLSERRIISQTQLISLRSTAILSSGEYL